MIPFPGALVTVWEGGEFSLGVVVGEEKRRVRLVLASGREIRVQPARIGWEVEPPGTVPGLLPEQKREAGRRVEQAERRIEERIGQIDVALVWQILSEGQAGDSLAAGFDTGDLAELALDSRSGESRAATVRALRHDGLHFARKADRWIPRSAEQVSDLLHERERIAEREDQTRALFDALRGAVRDGGFEPTGSEYERRYLDALQQLAVHDESTPEAARGLAMEALAASGLRYDRPHEGAFRLLRSVGRFEDDDANLQVLRYSFHTRFPDDVLRSGDEAAVAGFDETGREDLTRLAAFSIDSARTREIDDAISLETTKTGLRVGIHIAAPGAFVEVGGPIDREAFARGLTHYHPDRRLKMLPAAVAEQAASLAPHERRPALSFLVDVGPAGELIDSRIVESIVCSQARLDYDQADRCISTGEGEYAQSLAALDRWAQARERRRLDNGAISLRTPEIDIYLDEQGEIRLERIEPFSASRRIVSEAMVLAGEIAAAYCVEEKLPVIYRRQPAPDSRPQFPAEGVWDPVAVRRIRRTLGRGDSGLRPGRHHGLGLDAYVQVTSPIRRFQDMTTGRQIAAQLTGAPPPHDAEAIQRIAATTERAEIDARRAERTMKEFWLLRYLERSLDRTVEAIVVATEPRPVVLLTETLREQPMPSLTDVEAGQRLQLRVERVNPRAGLLALRRVD